MAPRKSPGAYYEGVRAGESAPRLLLLTYSFPPDRSVGALRWQQLSAYLVAQGWAIDVVTLDPAELPWSDPARVDALPERMRVFGVRHPLLPIQRVQRVLLALRRRLRGTRRGRSDAPTAASTATAAPTDGAALPIDGAGPAAGRPPGGALAGMRRVADRAWDAYLARVADAWFRRWARDVAAFSCELVRVGYHRAVITSGPPHMAHVAGRLVAERMGVPLVADFRDPWSLASHLTPEERAQSAAVRLAAQHERPVIAVARLVVLNTEAARRDMARAYPGAAARMLTVMNGADGDPVPPAPRGERFVIAYAGSIYIDRDPTPLFRALRRVVDALALTPRDVGIEMVGSVQEFRGTPVRELAEREGVGAFVALGASVTRAEALAFQARAQMLVSLPQASLTQTPAKTFEYVNFSAWLLIFAPAESATAQLLRDTEAHLVGLADVDAAAAAIRRRYEEWRAGALPVAVNADGRFGREAQAARLAEALERVTGSSPRHVVPPTPTDVPALLR